MNHIISVIERFFPLSGGSETQLFNLSKSLIKYDLNNIVITKQFANLSKYETVNGIEIHRISKSNIKCASKINSLKFLLFFIPSAIFKILKFRKNIIGVYFVGGNYFYGLIAWVCKKYNIPTYLKIVTNIDGEIGHLKGGRVLKSIKRKLANNIDYIISTTSYIEGALLKEGYNKNKIVFIPNGLDTNIFRPKDDKISNSTASKVMDNNYKFIIYTGRLSRHKNIDLLIRSFIAIKKNSYCAKWKLIILGDGKMIDDSVEYELKDLANNNPYSNDIIFTGKVDDVYNYLKLSSIFVLPSTSEGLPNCLLEAMSCGLACIGSDVIGINDLIKHSYNGLLFDLDASGRSLIESLNLLILDDKLQSKLSSNARKYILSNNTLDIVSKKYLKLFST